MYTENQLEAFAGKSSTCKEVFSSIVTSKSDATRGAAKVLFETLAKVSIEKYQIEASVVNPVAKIQEMFSLEDLLSVLMQATQQKPKSLFGKFLAGTGFGQTFALRSIAFMYDLDFSQLDLLRKKNSDDCMNEIFHAIILSGIYLSLPTQEIRSAN